MKKWEQEAIKLKYQGKTHAEIARAVSKLCNITVTEGTMRNYFALDGRLYLPYLEYSTKNEKYIEEEVRKEFKDQAKHAGKIYRTILQKALKQGDLKLAKEIVDGQMDRAGLTVVKKVEVEKTERKELSDEQFFDELRRLGIDPESGLRIGAPKTQAD